VGNDGRNTRQVREIAEAAPVIAVRPGLFDRARRARRRRQAAGVTAAFIAAAVVTLGVYAGPPPPRPAQPSGPADGTALPSRVVAPPRGTADVRPAPVGEALVVFSGGEDSHQEGLFSDSYPLVIVGAEDRYRTYDRPEWTFASSWSPTFLLSPDGRYLLMADRSSGSQSRSRILDLRTGKVRGLAEGAPLAWSPDGRQAILVSYDGDATSMDPQGAEIRVVDIPTGQVAWRSALPPRPRAGEALTAALSADGSALAVQHDAELTVYRRTGGGWKRGLDTERLAGPAAWTPDGRHLAVAGGQGQLALLDAAAGTPTPQPGLPTMATRPFDLPDHARLVAWRGETPILVAGNRVLLLADSPRTLLTAPAGTSELQIATDRLGQPPRRPGPPRPGPLTQRYRHLIAATGAFVVLALALTPMLRRRREAR
jgi:hypothetical protein